MSEETGGSLGDASTLAGALALLPPDPNDTSALAVALAALTPDLNDKAADEALEKASDMVLKSLSPRDERDPSDPLDPRDAQDVKEKAENPDDEPDAPDATLDHGARNCVSDEADICDGTDVIDAGSGMPTKASECTLALGSASLSFCAPELRSPSTRLSTSPP